MLGLITWPSVVTFTIMTENSMKKLGLEIRNDFPIFAAQGKEVALTYLDTAASSQKPKCVIDRLTNYLSSEHANIHRGAYSLSAQATEAYDLARIKVANFIGVKDPRGLIFTRGTTESINLVAYAGEVIFEEGDTILLTLLEHHSNIVPWQILAQRKKLRIVFADINQDGTLNLADFKLKLQEFKPKLCAYTQISNAIGSIVPVDELTELAHAFGALVLVDGAQAVPHCKIDVVKANFDFYVFSAHKLYGPTGIGALYAKPEILERFNPFMGGGDMIQSVTTAGSTWAELPSRFEAGTPAIAEAIAFGTAVDYVSAISLQQIHQHEASLMQLGLEVLSREPGVEVYGPAKVGKSQASILSFNVKNLHPHDLATVADSFNVQIRAGHHCAMPLLKRLGISASARASLGLYSDASDFDVLIEAIRRARKIFGA